VIDLQVLIRIWCRSSSIRGFGNPPEADIQQWGNLGHVLEFTDGVKGRVMRSIQRMLDSRKLKRIGQLAVTVLALILSFTERARAENDLLGKWQSDATRSMAFNNQYVKLEEKSSVFLSQLMGHLTITFSTNTVEYEMPGIETKAPGGKKTHLAGFHETHPYKILGRTVDTFAIRTKEPVTGKDAITTYNFEGPNVIWVYSGGGARQGPIAHLREYFVRIK
jgi:hypothetical protein